MKEIRKIRSVVFQILEEDESARNSDKHLYVEVVKKLNPNLAYTPLAIALHSTEIPNMETVRRTRQYLQAKYDHLKADDNVQAAREINEEICRKVFGNGGWMDKTS